MKGLFSPNPTNSHTFQQDQEAFSVPLMNKEYAWQDVDGSKPARLGKLYKVAGGVVVLVLFLAALSIDPAPIYEKANTIWASGDDLEDPNLPGASRMATDSTPQSDIVIEGSKWAQDVHYAVDPVCHHNETRTFYPAKKKTALATFPRSGNSWLRELLERSTGHLTTSSYCDTVLQKTFVGECDHDNLFFQKTHYPALGRGIDATVDDTIAQVVTIIRNPIDCVMSYFSYLQAIGSGNAKDRHEAHVSGVIGESGEDQHQIRSLTARWIRFYHFWNQHPVPQMKLRYEDLRNQPLGLMMNLIAFIMPEEDRPDVEQIICALELQESTEAYHSAKRTHFSSWNQYTPEMRSYIVQSAADIWCQAGYDTLLEDVHGREAVESTGVDCQELRGRAPSISN